MNLKHLMLILGSTMLFIGVYLFPFGQDYVIYSLTNLTGSYWSGIVVLYAICCVLILFGVIFLRYGVAIIGNPLYAVMLVIALIVAYIMITQIFVSVKGGYCI